MVRRSTLILLLVFVVLLGAAFYLQKNPLPTEAELTPSPTSSPRVLQGWESSDITRMELKDSQGNAIQIAQDTPGNWKLSGIAEGAVEPGMAEQIRVQIAEMRSVATLPQNFQLDALGLNPPARTLAIRDAQGKQITLNIGKTDPTESGYYVQLSTQPPVVIDKFTLDGIVDLFSSALPTPTPPVIEQQPATTPAP